MLPKPRWRPAPSWIYFRWLFWTHIMPCFNHWSQPSFRICCASIHHRTVLACHLLTVITGQFLPVNQWSVLACHLLTVITGQFLPVNHWSVLACHLLTVITGHCSEVVSVPSILESHGIKKKEFSRPECHGKWLCSCKVMEKFWNSTNRPWILLTEG